MKAYRDAFHIAQSPEVQEQRARQSAERQHKIDEKAKRRLAAAEMQKKAVMKLQQILDAFCGHANIGGGEGDLVLIALDFEGRLDVGKPNEIGIATLDTRDLLKSRLTSSIDELISTRSFAFGSHAYNHTVACNFLFGKPSVISPAEAKETITNALRITDSDSENGELRRILLVGYSFHAEMDCLM